MKHLLVTVLAACMVALAMAGVAESQCQNGMCPWTPRGSLHSGGEFSRNPDPARGVNRREVEPRGIWRSVVRVRVDDPRSAADDCGSGVLAEFRGRVVVLTAWHVVSSQGAITVKSCDGVRFGGRIFASEPGADIAILSVNPPRLHKCHIAKCASMLPKPGDSVQVVGWGKHENFGVMSGKVGRFVRLGNMRDEEAVEVTGGGAQSGDSGGAIFNDRGEVVGVVTGTDSHRVIGPQIGRILSICTAKGEKWSLLPWRNDAQKKLDALEKKLMGLEARQVATTPPPADTIPGADGSDFDKMIDAAMLAKERLAKVESQQQEQLKLIDANAARFKPLEDTADKARQLAEQWPELQAALRSLEQTTSMAAGTANEAKAGADKAVEAVTGIAGKAAEAASVAANAQAEAADTQASVDAALDEDAPDGLLARIKGRLESTVAATIGARLAEKVGWQGFGIAGVVLAVIIWLVRRDILDKINTGDPLLIEKLAARTRNEIDDRLAAKAGDRVMVHADPEHGLREELADIKGVLSGLRDKAAAKTTRK